MIEDYNVKDLKEKILNSGLTVSELVRTAWASASTFRGSDYRGGANGARIRLEPQVSWEVNNPEQLRKVLNVYEEIKRDFDQRGAKKVSLADLIVLGGNVAIEKAADFNVEVEFTSGRTDALQEKTDARSFKVLEPKADAFRNYVNSNYDICPEEMMVDKAQLLKLTVSEMTVLIGGLRVLGANYDDSELGVFTDYKEELTNDFFVNLLDMNTMWKPMADNPDVFEGSDRKTGEVQWVASRVDLIFGSHSVLRAIAEVYASDDGEEKFIADFVRAWNKVMNADLF